jgi:hypothetical protein
MWVKISTMKHKTSNIQNRMPMVSNKKPNPKGVKLSSRWLLATGKAPQNEVPKGRR